MASLRNDRVESAWLTLVNSIEQRGISLVDPKDPTLRRRLLAAGFTAPYAPRVYTRVRALLVVGLPLLVVSTLALTGSSPAAPVQTGAPA